MPQAACLQAKKLLNLTYARLTYSQLEEAMLWVTKMCKTSIPMTNSTHVGITENATMVNLWHLFTMLDGEYGEQHHAAHLSMYIIAVIFLVILVLCIALAICWLCRTNLGRLGTWITMCLVDLQGDYREFRSRSAPAQPIVRYHRDTSRALLEIPENYLRREEEV